MTGEPRKASVIARGAVLCYKLYGDTFGRILADRPEIAEQVSAVLAEREVELQAARENLNSKDQDRRKREVSNRILSGIQRFFGLGD